MEYFLLPIYLFAIWLLYIGIFAFERSLSTRLININVKNTTLSNGYLGSRNDEERSEMRYVMRIAEFSESSNFSTQIALLGSPRSTLLSSIGSTISQHVTAVQLACWPDNESLFVT